ncbi:GDP-mannose-dependent alpha-(1-6)-phosphatidylinositol monomannoside mannosyltransferase [Planctomycetes bacterium Poly30]|uniref:GDP-mannose-dependent alpha-(1-6)-phosphatidylinositol monomannoside mannosyltransferase n=1 Tax=Saltatorellus ferox TaxID=2528018 RepID=A0A518EPP1_9BACT|nr:GDP-mannose-dependent alpha-(1-6)-phosphatidylinositol monomannoside mannosyltransferase [Planctomycetes bacterium Poly30]
MTNPESIQNVLFLHPSAEYRGADRTIVQLVAAVDRSRWQPVVVLPRRGPLIGELQELGAQIEVGPLGVVGEGFAPVRFLKLFLQLPVCLFFVWRMVMRYRPALVHTHTSAVLGGALAAHFFGRRHLWHIHRILESGGWRDKALARTIHLLTDSVVCSSEGARAALIRLLPAISEKAWMVRNAVNVDRVAPDPTDRMQVRSSLGLDDECTLVLMVSRLSPERGHMTLLRAAKAVRRDHPDTHFLLVGEPSAEHKQYAESLDAAIQELKLEGVVTRMPFQRRVGAIYAAADLVCIPADEPDPFRMVALEAMAAGKPVVASSTTGTEEFLIAGQTGLVFEPGDVERLTWCISALVSDPAKRAHMGEAGRALQASQFLVGRFRNEFDRAWSHTIKRTFVLPAKRASVVHITLGKANPERMNGINSVVHYLAGAQQAAGIAVEVWGITKDTTAETLPRTYPLRLFKRGIQRFTCTRDIRQAILELDSTAVVHLHGAFLPEFTAITRRLRRRGVPYILTPHGAYRREALRKNAFQKRIWLALREKKMLRGARAVQALSGRELLEMEDITDIGHVQIIPNGQHAVTLAPGAEAPPIPGPNKQPIFAFCGRMGAYTKGLDALIEGFARYVAGRGEGTLWMIGDGPDRAALEARCEELSIHRRVHFFGPLFGHDKALRLCAADAFIHPSRHEGMPTAVLEAGSLGLPMLVTSGTNLDQEVRSASAGYVIADVTPEAIADTLFTAEREHENGQMAHRARNAAWLIASTFSWQRIALLTGRYLYGLEGLPDPDARESTNLPQQAA